MRARSQETGRQDLEPVQEKSLALFRFERATRIRHANGTVGPVMELFMRALLALLLIAVPTAAFAHTGHGDTSGFMHGFMHPVGGIDHILAMVAVGVFAYVLGGKA